MPFMRTKFEANHVICYYVLSNRFPRDKLPGKKAFRISTHSAHFTKFSTPSRDCRPFRIYPCWYCCCCCTACSPVASYFDFSFFLTGTYHVPVLIVLVLPSFLPSFPASPFHFNLCCVFFRGVYARIYIGPLQREPFVASGAVPVFPFGGRPNNNAPLRRAVSLHARQAGG